MKSLPSIPGQLFSLLAEKTAMILSREVPERQQALVLRVWPPQLDGWLSILTSASF